MDTDTGYPIGQAIADTSHALAGELGLDTNTVKRVLSPWVCILSLSIWQSVY